MSGHYIITGGMPVGADSTTLTFRAFYKGAIVDQTVFIGKLKSGSPGGSGVNGDPAVSMSVTKLSMMVLSYAEGTPVDPSFAGMDGQLTVLHGSDDVTYASVLSATAVGCTGSINTANNVPVAVQPMGYYRVTAMPADTATLTLSALYNGHTYVVVVTLVKAKGGYEIVASLPGTNLFVGRMVFLLSDQKLYQYKTGGWTAAVAAVDVAGMLSSDQIAGLDAAKLLGQVTAAQVNVVGQGPALNDDPMFSDRTAWQTWLWGSVPTFVMNGEISSTPGAVSSLVGVRGIITNSFKTYRMSVWLYNSGANGLVYIRPSYRDVNNVEQAQGLTVGEGIVVPQDGQWHRYAGNFVVPGAYLFMAPGLLLNYLGTTGYIAALDLRIEEVIVGDLIQARTIQAGSLVANSLTANEIASRTIQAGNIATGTLTANEIYGGTITGDKLAAGNIITASAQINDGVIISAKIGNLQVTTAQIADLTVGTNKITGNAVTRMGYVVSAANFVGSGTVMSFSYTPDTAAPIVLQWSATVYCHLVTGYGTFTYAINKNGTALWQQAKLATIQAAGAIGISGITIDPNGAAGVPRTYTLQWLEQNNASQIESGATLTVLEVKK